MPLLVPGVPPYLKGESFQAFHECLADQNGVALRSHVRSRSVPLPARRYALRCPAINLFGALGQRVFSLDGPVVERQSGEPRIRTRYTRRLPVAPTPLLLSSAGAMCDLRQAVGVCFAPMRYDWLSDNTQPLPLFAMHTEDLDWIGQRLRTAGVRSATIV